jgi:DNA polymerase III epsilon subunit-like protein
MPRASEVLRRFQKFIEGAVVMAHNASFDIRMINGELERARLPLLETAHMCTRNLARRLLPGLWDYKLSTVARKLGVAHGLQAHRALGDALLVGRVALKLLETA